MSKDWYVAIVGIYLEKQGWARQKDSKIKIISDRLRREDNNNLGFDSVFL